MLAPSFEGAQSHSVGVCSQYRPRQRVGQTLNPSLELLIHPLTRMGTDRTSNLKLET